MTLSKYLLETILEGYDIKMNFEKEANVAAITLCRNGYCNRVLFKTANNTWNDENIVRAMVEIKKALSLADKVKRGLPR